jgi:CBS domain-containing protein
MPSDHPELEQVVTDLREGNTATPVTIRTFLSWFGAKRRTPGNVEYINQQMSMAGLRTVPNYLNIWVDTPITFELIATHAAEAESRESALPQSTSNDPELASDSTSAGDPSFRIGRIASANNPPVSVKPNATLEEAVTLMLAHNFSQLPVMTTDREVKGVVSWTSIGARLATKTTGADVQTYMDDHQEINISASLFTGIKIILEHNYVLVRSLDRKISGIVTSSDIALQFEEISTPFLLLAEIENNLRSLIRKKLTMADIKRACGEEHLPKEFSGVSELTFGNYVRILEYVDNWAKLGLYLDRVAFCSELSEINTIRNDVMHFDPDPLLEKDLSKLRNVAKMFDLLRSLGAF